MVMVNFDNIIIVNLPNAALNPLTIFFYIKKYVAKIVQLSFAFQVLEEPQFCHLP